MGPSEIVIYVISILLFIFTMVFAILNVVKFYKHKSYALGIFYFFTIASNLVRLLFFIFNFYKENSYWNAVFLCFPASLTLSIGLSQIMNYFILYIRLRSYEEHRAKKGGSLAPDEVNKASKKELIVTAIFTVLIFAYPILIIIKLATGRDGYESNIVEVWDGYDLFYMSNFILLTILLVISTLLSLRLMKRVFGDQSMKEEKAIKFILLIFCGTYILKVVCSILLKVFEDSVESIFENMNTVFNLLLLLNWITLDSVPIVAMLVIHYKNFSSFQGSQDDVYSNYSYIEDNLMLS